MTSECYRFIVSGRVQSVYFRQSCATQARALNLAGWVRNLPDGRVEGLANGSVQALAQLREWLGHGPPAARVYAVQWFAAAESSDMPPIFEVRR